MTNELTLRPTAGGVPALIAHAGGNARFAYVSHAVSAVAPFGDHHLN